MQVHLNVTDSPNLLNDTEVKITFVARPHSCQLHQSCAGVNTVYSYIWAECVFIHKHYFLSKLFAVVCEAFSSAYTDEEISNKITIYQMARKSKILEHSKCFSLKSAHWATEQLKLQPYWFWVVHKQQEWDTTARIQYFHCFYHSIHEGASSVTVRVVFQMEYSVHAVHIYELIFKWMH
jgi:hypothetical protein